jgi:hypothetical protein
MRRFEIGQIGNPIALDAATTNLRDQLGINGVPTTLIDKLIVDRKWGSTITPLVEVMHPDKLSGTQKEKIKQGELYAQYEDDKVIHLDMLKQERKKLSELNERRGVLCKLIIEQCCSTQLQGALATHSDYNLPKHTESLQVDIVKLINVIFELVNTTDGNNTASMLLGSIFNDTDGNENICKFIRHKQISYNAYQKIADPHNTKAPQHVEAMMLRS